MSRIGNMPIAIPDGIKVDIKDQVVEVSSGKQSLSQTLPDILDIKIEDNQIQVSRKQDSKDARAMHGLMRSLVNNMVVGLHEGFTRNLEVNGVGFRVQKQGNKLVMNLGYSHPVEIVEPEGITIEVPANNRIQVKGADKQLVGEVAAKIRASRVPDVYHGKGIKYAEERLRIKEGKTGAKS